MSELNQKEVNEQMYLFVKRWLDDLPLPFEEIKKIPVMAISCCLARLSKQDDLLKEQEKEIKALRLLVEWAEECDFGFDQFPDEYEQYKDEITDMKYIEGMIHVAKRTLEDHGAFEECQ